MDALLAKARRPRVLRAGLSRHPQMPPSKYGDYRYACEGRTRRLAQLAPAKSYLSSPLKHP